MPTARRRAKSTGAGGRASAARITVSSPAPQRVVLLPPRDLRSSIPAAKDFLASLNAILHTAGGVVTKASLPGVAAMPAMRVVDSIAENGA